jgi:hypothetical protein
VRDMETYERTDSSQPIGNLGGVTDGGVTVSPMFNGIKEDSDQVHLFDHTKACFRIELIDAGVRFNRQFCVILRRRVQGKKVSHRS